MCVIIYITRRPLRGRPVMERADLAGAILNALADVHSRRIVCSTMARAMTVEEICSEQRIPLSTGYRKVGELVDAGILMVESVAATTSGKSRVSYKTSFTRVSLDLKDGALSIGLSLGPDSEEGPVTPSGTAFLERTKLASIKA